MGASGSGKSTFMNLLGCLDRPNSGRYLLERTDVSQHDKKALTSIRNQKIGFLFQGFQPTIAHNSPRKHRIAYAVHENRSSRSAEARHRGVGIDRTRQSC
jgi:putative ABC transport system ATP-binding protein